VNILSNERYPAIITLLKLGLLQRAVANKAHVHRSAGKRAAEELAKRTTPSTGSEDENVPTCPPGITRQIGNLKKQPSQCEPYRDRKAGSARSQRDFHLPGSG
jgi:hypothetical protein